jgi:general L-amino acid transport system substrate-binding protein
MKLKTFLAAGAAVVLGGAVAGAGTLDEVKSAGVLKCGIDGGLPGFSAPDDAGAMRGIDADTCRAVAAAVLGNADKVEFVPLTAKERFTALASGEVDVLSRNTTHTLTRDSSLGINFTYYNYIDGQGFLAKKELGVSSAKELDGAAVCVQSGTTTELNLSDYFRTNGMDFKPVGYDTSVQTREGFEGGSCDVLTSDVSQLAAIRSELKNPAGAVILPEVISKEPLGPVVRQGDDQWFNIVKWSLYAMINAEEYGVTSENAASLKDSSNNPNVRRLLGSEGEMGSLLGLDSDWGYRIVTQVGNYGEVFERTVGPNTPLGLPRGPNALWNKGGILYAPPIR